jgi:hypothetical protein
METTVNKKEAILNYLQAIVESNTEKRNVSLEKLTKHITAKFHWVAKEMYCADYMVRRVSLLREFVECHNEEELDTYLGSEYRLTQQWLRNPRNIRTQASCEVQQMTSTWEYECEVSYLDCLTVVKKWNS